MEGKNSLFQRQAIVLALMYRAEMSWLPGTQAHGWMNSTAYRKRSAWKHSQQQEAPKTKLCLRRPSSNVDLLLMMIADYH